MLPDKKFFETYAKKNGLPWLAKNILMEYLQIQILKNLSLSDYNNQISFLGGTCLRYVHKIERFSEDLDFDLIQKKDFKIKKLQDILVAKLELAGFSIDTKLKTTENIHIIYFKFKNVLQEFGFRVHKDEKFLIKFEIDYKGYKKIQTETVFIEAFNEKFPILVNTFETLFAQKILAFMFRPYQKGRDFYDLVWFLAQKNIEPNYKLLQEKNLKIKNRQEVVAEMKKVLKKINLKQASQDVERFLFHPEQAKWILEFEKYLDSFIKN